MSASGPATRRVAYALQQICLVCRSPALLLSIAVFVGVFTATNCVASPSQPRFQIETGTHAAPIRRIAVAPGRNRVVTASDDKTARVWNLTTGELLSILRVQIGDGDVGRLYGAAIHPEEDWVAIAGATDAPGSSSRIMLFSIESGRFLRAFEAGGGNIKHLVWSADGTLLFAAFAGDNAVRAFNRRGDLVLERRLFAPAYGLASSRTGLVAATSLDGRVVIFESREERAVETQVLRTGDADAVGVDFSPDGSRLLVGFLKQTTAPELFDVQTGRSQGRVAVPSTRIGNYLSVAWSWNGATLIASGSARNHERRQEAFFFSAVDARFLGRESIATDTILDFKALPDGRFAYASFDGSWGVVGLNGIAVRSVASISDLRGADRLLLSPDALTVQWTFDGGERPAVFSFATRLVTFGAAHSGLSAPRSKAGWSDNSIWENTRTPTVRGRAIQLAMDETSRALAYFSDRRSAMFGTTQRLIRLDEHGQIRWEVRTGGEVRAVNLSADDRLAVTAMSDGTLRWWRTADGVLVLSLLATRDGRWITWSDAGYFDASAGADRLAGWSVNRTDSPTSDFFSLSRFRDRFNRPDVIDRMLRTLDTGVEKRLALPPVLESGDRNGIHSDSARLSVPYVVRPGEGGVVNMEVRVNGRPEPEARVLEESVSGGEVRGRVSLPKPDLDSIVQVVARNDYGTSEPLGLIVRDEAIPLHPPALTASNRVPSPSENHPPSATSPAVQPAHPVAGVTVPDAHRPLEVAGAPVSPAVSMGPITSPPIPSANAAIPPLLMPVAPTRPRMPGQPRLFVLAIGISKYKNPSYDLGLAAKDARDFSAAMRQQSGRLYSEVIVRTLTDADASRRSVLEHLHWLSENAGPSDIGILFFAGHGLNVKDGQYYFLPHDADHERLAQTGIPEEELRKSLGRMRGKALLFVDTCFGGSALSRAGSSELARMANNLSAAENGVVVFASSSGRQLSEEKDAWGNGAFTKAVLSGLAGKADLTQSGRVTFKGLDFYVSEEVHRLTEGRQTPVTISPTGVPDFAVARVGAT